MTVTHDPEIESEELPWPARAAGVLLHPTSLPGPHGIGELGAEAHNFVRMLASAGQFIWQIMPLGPPGSGNSPYAARSSFAGNWWLISLEELANEGLLDHDDFAGAPAFDPNRVEFDRVAAWKEPLLWKAFGRFDERRGDELEMFVERHKTWLPDFALYMAVKGEDERCWAEWPRALAEREPTALDEATRRLAGRVRFHAFLQWAFFRQWHALRAHANHLGVRILGDVPIFPDYDSADVWANQRMFKLDEHGRPEVVAGVPPDAFSQTGQRWGNPLYRWDALAADGYGWWVERLRGTFELVDMLRIDHFRGFEAAWEIPADCPTAEQGQWVAGPGREFFDRARAVLGELPIVVEDLGLITKAVRKLRDDLGYPGMKVLHFAFGDDARNPYLPHNLPLNSVVYTGTHDNDTTLGWFQTRGHDERERILRYLAVDGHDIVSDLIRTAYASVASTAIVPLQDILRLGTEARMNVPGEPWGNWGWRFRWDQVDGQRMRWLHDIAILYGRARP